MFGEKEAAKRKIGKYSLNFGKLCVYVCVALICFADVSPAIFIGAVYFFLSFSHQTFQLLDVFLHY